ncbi:porin PorA family protein [Yinghuangia seranimata]|uniref:porin PorA family protein n=1 Tax=Yinghuangia seranimata TaxID=408067 RepID=UPI00248B7190|nr:porin PorA family protein [Yinghuangia seranimata]MDI2131092.1 porin PorA family protein [Yinghuangia seranimata]
MRTNTVLRGIGVVVGLALIAGAFVLAYVITPDYVERVPGDTDVTRSYAGTFRTLVDAQEVAKGNIAAAIKRDVPMAVQRTVKVEATSGNTALVSDSRTTSAAGTQVEKTDWKYAVNRKTLQPATSHPADWTVVDAKGLTVSWPLGAQKKTYVGWRPETMTTTPLTYARTESKSGVSTYVYEAHLPPTRITDSQVLASLPPAVPRATLALVAQLGTLPPAAKEQLAALLPTLGDPVPLAYTLESADTFWVHPETGIVVDTQRSQQRVAGVIAPSSGAFVPLLPVSDVSYQQTPKSVKDAAGDANDAHDAILILGTVLPIVVGIVGALLIAAVLFIRRLRPRGAQTPPANA